MSIPATTPVRMVCFDLGGVLVRICVGWDEACLAAGVAVRQDPSGLDGEETRRSLSGLLEVGRASHLLGLAKPGSAIYAEFEQRVGRRGEDILFFDDRAENVDAARRLHWHAHRIDPQGDPIAQIRAYLHHYLLLET